MISKNTRYFFVLMTLLCLSVNAKDNSTKPDITQKNQTKIEFETQLLEPFGGKISMPKDWYYRERHGGPSYIWILSKENPDEGPYVTGVKIQYIGGIEEGTGKTPEQFLRDFVEQKKKQVEVLSECAAQEQTFFTKICLETIEPTANTEDKVNYRIQYSLFWSNEMGWAIMMIQGTTEVLWEQNSDIFQAMKDFEVIDMDRFE